jgi:hypothetical protein
MKKLIILNKIIGIDITNIDIQFDIDLNCAIINLVVDEIQYLSQSIFLIRQINVNPNINSISSSVI